jgi:hypothetical protein
VIFDSKTQPAPLALMAKSSISSGLLSSSSDEDAIRDLLVAFDIIILLMKAWILSRLPNESSVSVAMMMPFVLEGDHCSSSYHGTGQRSIGSSSERIRVLI